MKYKYLLLPAIFFFLYHHNIIAQSIRLIDPNDSNPIIGAHYKYAEQYGLSDSTGKITIDYLPGTELELSHISYGQWFVADKNVKKALQKGKLFKKEEHYNLQPVSIITLRPSNKPSEKKQLEAQDKLAHDVSLILNQNAAISSIRKSGSTSFDPVLRGFKYEQLNVVIDGLQCSTTACPSRMDPPTSQVAPNMIDQVEIFKGPHSLRYGNSLGGTINFISADPEFSEVPDLYGRWSGAYEGNGNIFRTEGMAGIRQKTQDFSIFTSWSKGDDYKDGEGMEVPAKFRRLSYGANYGVKLSKKQILAFSVTHNFTKDAEFPALPMDLRKDDTWLLNLKHSYKNTNSENKLHTWKTAVYATAVDHFMDNRLKHFDKRIVFAETGINTWNYGARTEGKWLFDKSIWYLGADYKAEEAKGTRIRDFVAGPNQGKVFRDNVWQNSIISKTAAFSEFHWIRPNFKWVFSGRFELNRSDNRDVAEEFSKVYPHEVKYNYNPSLSVGGIKDFKQGMSMGLWLARAQRSGGISEKYINYFPVGLDPYELVGNPDIKPEVNYQADLNYSIKREKISLELNLFASIVQDYISSFIADSLMPRLPTSPGVRVFSNISQALLTGFEFNYRQLILPNIQGHLSVAYTYGEDQQRKEPLPEIAPLDARLSFTANLLQNRLHPQILVRHVLQQDRISSTFGETKTPSFTLIDLEVSYTFFDFINVSGGIQNLFDEAYYEHLSRSVRGIERAIYAPGRNFYFSVNVDLR